MIGPQKQNSNSQKRDDDAIAYYACGHDDGDPEKHYVTTNDNIECSIRATDVNNDQNVALRQNFYYERGDTSSHGNHDDTLAKYDNDRIQCRSSNEHTRTMTKIGPAMKHECCNCIVGPKSALGCKGRVRHEPSQHGGWTGWALGATRLEHCVALG